VSTPQDPARKGRRRRAPRRFRVAVLVHPDLVPPEEITLRGEELEAAPWKTEHDVLRTLQELGHEAWPVPVGAELGPIRQAVTDQKPHVVFNLLEGFADEPSFGHNVVAYLELLKVPYTGCNSRGLFLARDKGIAKQILTYHRVPVPAHTVYPRGQRFRRPRRPTFPLIVKSLTMDASVGISQASVVENEAKLEERVRFIHESVGTHALVEPYIDGRELYVGVLGNQRLRVLPVWELILDGLPEQSRPIATERLKWNKAYQKRHGIDSGPARNLSPELAKRIDQLCRRAYRALRLNGCARIDLRLDAGGRIWLIEANPNPQLSLDEDLAQSARHAGLTYPALIQRLLQLGMSWDPTGSD